MKKSTAWLVLFTAYIVVGILLFTTAYAFFSLSSVAGIFICYLIPVVIPLVSYKKEKGLEQFQRIFGVAKKDPGAANKVEEIITARRLELDLAFADKNKAEPNMEYIAAVKKVFEAEKALEQAAKIASKCGFEELALKTAFPAPTSRT